MVHACQKTGKCASPEVSKTAKSISYKDADEFASTKHKGLPEKVKKKKHKCFREFLEQNHPEFLEDTATTPKCSKCGEPTPSAELHAYKGICEECYNKRFKTQDIYAGGSKYHRIAQRSPGQQAKLGHTTGG